MNLRARAVVFKLESFEGSRSNVVKLMMYKRVCWRALVNERCRCVKGTPLYSAQGLAKPGSVHIGPFFALCSGLASLAERRNGNVWEFIVTGYRFPWEFHRLAGGHTFWQRQPALLK
jgi:hypothetical protein